MATKIFTAIIGDVKPDEYKKVVALSTAVRTAMVKPDAILIYTVPNPTLASLLAQEALINASEAKVLAGDHSYIATRDGQSVTLYGLLKQEANYVNVTAPGDEGKLKLSGFPVSKEPAPKEIPGQVIIKRAVDGPNPNSIKFFIESLKQSGLVYKIQTSKTPDIESSWVTVTTVKSMRKLIVPGLTLNVLNYYRIGATNSHGDGKWSKAFPFTAQN